MSADFLMLIFWLVFAHCMADFALQSPSLYARKATSVMYMLAHCMIWTGCICTVLCLFGINNLWKMLFLLTGHFFCDTWKVKKSIITNKDVWLDQAFHLVQCFLVGL